MNTLAKKTEWILVGNAAHVRLFRRDSPSKPLVPLATLEHPQSRLKGRQLAEDRPGRHATDNSHGGNHFEPHSDVHRKEHERFAREIGARLDAGLAADGFVALWIFASSPFLGELKAALSDAVAQRVAVAHDTDLSALGLAEIEHRLRDPALMPP
jgi:protein required for attachment to host cells